MAESPMRPLLRWPIKVYWASRWMFVKPGLHVWLGSRHGHLRLIPVPRPRGLRKAHRG